MVRYPYLLFDADDTLLDFSRNGDKAFSLLCAKYSFPCNEESRALFEAFNQPLWRDLERGTITKEFLKTERFRRFWMRCTAVKTPRKSTGILWSSLAAGVF